MKEIGIPELKEEFEKTQDIIFEITNQKPVLFRPPGGYINNEFADFLSEHNVTPVLWSWRQDTKDWSSPSVESIVNIVLNNLQDGDIILFHDYTVKNSPTPQALEIILPKLKEMGYSFVTVSELIAK